MRRRNSIFAFAGNATKYLAGIPRNTLFAKRLSASDTMSRLANGRRVGCRVAFGLKSQSQSPRGVLFRNSNRRVLIRRVDTGATGNSCEADNPFLSVAMCVLLPPHALYNVVYCRGEILQTNFNIRTRSAEIAFFFADETLF